jgi:voltage-gated potassium channel
MWGQEANGRVRHPFEPAMLALALLVIPVVLLEEARAPAPWSAIATAGNWVIWAGFAAELALILAVARNKPAALRAHLLDVAIVVLTIPFAPALLASLRLARLLRPLRLLRLATLGSRAIAAERILTTRRGFRYVALLTVLLVVLAGVAASVADAEDISSPWTGVWWAITTVTTVGYGDIVPHTAIGRILAAVLMLVGIGFVSMLTAVIASSFVAHDSGQQSDSEQILAELQKINRRLDQLEATQRPVRVGPGAATRGTARPR